MQDPDKTTCNNISVANAGQALRQRAEDLAGGQTALLPAGLEALSPNAMRQTLHELQVHQIELEMQNEELLRAQLQLDTARARYFDLYDLAPVGYCTVSEQGLILEANIAVATLLGVARRDLVGQRISRFIVTSHQDAFYLHRKQLLASGEQQGCELHMVKSDGTPFWVHLTTIIALEDNGTPVQRMVLSDITERKQTEATLRQSERHFREVIEALPVAIYMTDAKGLLTHFNRAAVEFSGRIPELGTDQWCVSWKLFYPDGTPMPHDECPMAVALKGGRLVPGAEAIAERPDGTRVWFTPYPTPLFNAHGELTGGINMLVDITERKLLDQVLQENNVELKNAMSTAEKANLAKSDFLSSMSHELRTPLSAILGFAQLIESGSPPPTPTQKRSVDQILQAGWYLLELINEILDLAVVESGKLSLLLEPISLAEVMHECKTMIEPQAQQRGIGLTFPKLATPYFVKADSTRMKQILINLLSNAIKYNKAGGTVVVKCFETAPGRIRICVEDTGEGLSPEKIDHLFQPFNRLGQEARTEQGTGIGLVMTKRLVELMAGVIGVESTVGQGSVFWLEMDLTGERQPSSGAVPLPTSAQVNTGAEAPTHTLLYVEDNLANLMLVEELIARHPNMRLLKARDGNSGIEIARASLPDVILMDINLPGISGIEVMKILAKNPATTNIPVLALSANARPHDIDKGLESGFFRYITKPIKIDEFMATLDEALAFARAVSDRTAKKEDQ